MISCCGVHSSHDEAELRGCVVPSWSLELNKLLIIPGNLFSSEDTNFRLSDAVKDETLLRGAEVLRGLPM